MEVIESKRHLPPKRCQPSKRGRSLPSPSHSEDPPKLTLEDENEFKDPPKPTLEDENEFKVIAEDSSDVECTTLIKAVPYDRIQKDDQKEINAIIEDLSKGNVLLRIDKDGKKHFLYSDEDFEIIDLCGVGADEWPYTTGPVLQVIYVTISNRTHHSDFNIYGEISMTDYKRDTFYIYNCEPEDEEYVEEVDSGWHLYLTHCPIVPAVGGKVKFSLTNKDSKVQIFNKECDVKDAIEDTKKGTFTLECDGVGGYRAKMVFTKIPFAVIAKAEMFLRYTPPPCSGENKNSFEVHGKITANNVIVMNHKDRQEMVNGKRNRFIPDRYVFAVPLLSSLDVKVKLYSGNLELADDTYKVAACHGILAIPRASVFKCKAEDCFFEIDVDWIPHNDFFFIRIFNGFTPSPILMLLLLVAFGRARCISQ